MLKPRDTARPPQGMAWIYKHVDVDHEQRHSTYDHLKNAVRKFRMVNNLPLGSNFDNDFDDNICRNTQGENCVDTEAPSLVQRVSRFAVAMASWAGQGFPTRSREEVERIMDICKSCYYFTGESGLFRVGCRKCGCSAKKPYVASEVCPIDKWK